MNKSSELTWIINFCEIVRVRSYLLSRDRYRYVSITGRVNEFSRIAARVALATATHDEKGTGAVYPRVFDEGSRVSSRPEKRREKGRGWVRAREKKSKKLIEFYRGTVLPLRTEVLRVCAPRSAGHVCIYNRLQILTAPLSMWRCYKWELNRTTVHAFPRLSPGWNL